MDFQTFNFRDVFKTERTLLNYSGFYPRRLANKANKKYLLSAFVNVLIPVVQTLSMIMLMITTSEISTFAKCFSFFVTQVTFLGKLTNFLYFRYKLLDLEDYLQDPLFYGYSQRQFDVHIKRKLASIYTITFIFRFSCVCSICLFFLVPYLDENEENQLIIPGWFPYDTLKYSMVTKIFHILSIGCSAYSNSCFDAISWLLMVTAVAQFEILKENLSSIDYANKGPSTEEFLVKCIKHHKNILRLVKKTQFIFNRGIFLQFAASVLVICFTGFQLFTVQIKSVEFFRVTSYLFIMIVQVGMYCLYGHDVITSSEDLGTSIYMSNWYESKVGTRRTLVIFLERCKKPTFLTAGQMFTLSLGTLTSILKSSYSYLAVLNRLYGEA